MSNLNPDDMTASNIDTSWTISPMPEPPSVSPCVVQFMADYTFVRSEIIRVGDSPRIDTGMGEADLVLSIVNDSYAHNRMNKDRSQPALHVKEATADEMQELIDEIGGMPCDNS